MGKYGKWVGGVMGWALGGPIGAFLGFGLGTLIDNLKVERLQMTGSTQQGDFAAALIVLAREVVHADGKVDPRELQFIQVAFAQRFGPGFAAQAMQYVQGMGDRPGDIASVCQQVREHMTLEERLQLMHFLHTIAMADQEFHIAERRVLATIGEHLGLSAADMQSLAAMFRQDDAAAYEVLEISESASDDEVKKAYRKMATRHHPDKVAHLGEAAAEAAKEKFQRIQEAYDKVRKARGF